MNTAKRTILAAAAAPVLALAGAALAFGQSDTGVVEPGEPVASFAGHELVGYGYDEHFCWTLAGTAYAQAEALAVSMGEMQTPVYTFELHTGQRWDMCLWPADGNWEEDWNYRNCDFAREYHDSAWNSVIYGEADGAEYIYGDPYTGPQDETIVYAGAIADKMICIDSSSYHDPAHADLLLFPGDTRVEETDDTATEPGSS